jgi:hypothetical protein
VFVEPSGRNIVFIGLLKTWPLGDEFFFYIGRLCMTMFISHAL